jgi:molybdate transport system ATP-binding protein
MTRTQDILHIRFQVPLDRFDLEAEFTGSQRVTGLFGASGSGKTTWLETMAGLRRSARGFIQFGKTVWLDSDARVDVPPEQRGIGYVPQDHLLFPHKTVRCNLESGKRRALLGGHDFKRMLDHVVDVLELGSLLERSVRDLSGGERQRVALGRALCSGPRLLLLDEPLASLDLQLRQRILPFLQRVRDHFDVPMLIVSHNPIELQALCKDLIVLDQGRVLATGEPLHVLTRPDIFPFAQSQGFENIWSGRVKEHAEHTTSVVLGAADSLVTLTIPRVDTSEGGSVTVSVAADEILLSTTEPLGLSARNRIPADLEGLKSVGHRQLITARISPALPPVIIELTSDAIEDLHLAPGSSVYLLIKTSSITVYE